MIITIDNISDMGGTQEFLNIPQNKRTIPNTVRQIAAFYRDSNPHLEIQLHRDIFPALSSYLVNPAQLAKNANLGIYPRASGFQKDPYIVIEFATEDKPTSFWQECVDLCNQPGTHKFPINEVPTTYQHTPSLLRYRLKQFTNIQIRVLKEQKWLKLIVPRFSIKKSS